MDANQDRVLSREEFVNRYRTGDGNPRLTPRRRVQVDKPGSPRSAARW